ncbi:hypothetical protein GE09DRAFT_1086078 [Coniochaeta sp. 2T2.1]|nr:hypothetical protein GE09DRAFT_1086078 [Coniochaeta sp. 2T2.1]
MVAQDSTPAALESSPAAPDASTPESRAPPTGTDDTSYFSEVGLGPLARQLCLVGPSNDTARHGASGSRDRLMEVDDDGFIDANKPTFVLTTTIGDVTGSKTGIPRANTGAVQQPYLWEHTTNDKISHFMNGMRHENVPRILFSAQTTGSTDNHWVELGFYKERTRIKMGDVVLESNFTNYKLIIEAFHLMRFRKTELVKEWQRQTPEKAQLLQVLPHELNDSDIKQARYAVRPWDKLATLEVSSTGGLLGGPLVYRRLVLRRALPDPNNLLEEPRALYISVNTGQVVNQKPGDVIIPETERDYACLAAFFGKEKARVWQGHAYSDARATATRPSLGISHRNRPENAKPAAVSFSDENIPPKTANRGEHDGEYGNVSFQPTSQGPLTKSQKRVRLRQRMKERARQASQDQGGSQ